MKKSINKPIEKPIEKPAGSAEDKISKQFMDDIGKLCKKYDIKSYGAVFVIGNAKPILLLHPDVIHATKLLKMGHDMCKQQVMTLIGEAPNS